MKIVVKTSKPRNPFAVAAKQRRGNAHGSHQPTRRERYASKRNLQRLLKTDLD